MYSFLSSALDAMGGHRHAPAALYPLYPLGRKLDEPQNWSGQRLEERFFASAGNRTLIIQSVVRTVRSLMFSRITVHPIIH
jgi:hypothetical protein